MNFDYSEADEYEYEADFVATGKIEFEELEETDASAEIAELAAAVRAARIWH